MNLASKPANYVAATLAFLAYLWSSSVVMAACPSWPTIDRFRFSTSSDEVIDNLTGLIWKRCSEGQTWNISTGACTGVASSFSQAGALVHAQSLNRTMSSIGWRLPNTAELVSLADRGCQSPSIDTVAFPNTQSDWYASSTPPGSAAYVRAVKFLEGGSAILWPSQASYVRLVRSN